MTNATPAAAVAPAAAHNLPTPDEAAAAELARIADSDAARAERLNKHRAAGRNFAERHGATPDELAARDDAMRTAEHLGGWFEIVTPWGVAFGQVDSDGDLHVDPTYVALETRAWPFVGDGYIWDAPVERKRGHRAALTINGREIAHYLSLTLDPERGAQLRYQYEPVTEAAERAIESFFTDAWPQLVTPRRIAEARMRAALADEARAAEALREVKAAHAATARSLKAARAALTASEANAEPVSVRAARLRAAAVLDVSTVPHGRNVAAIVTDDKEPSDETRAAIAIVTGRPFPDYPAKGAAARAAFARSLLKRWAVKNRTAANR